MEILIPISQQSLSETIFHKLREAIIEGELPLGEKISELSLSNLLNVSRSPIREALFRLEGEGLVFRERNQGFYVWKPSPSDVDEILTLRYAYEILAAEININKMTDEHYETLYKMLSRQEQAVQENDYRTLTKEDRRFHEYMIELANHSRLLRSWKRLMGQWEVIIFWRIAQSPNISGSVLTDHKNIIGALRDKDFNRLSVLHHEINERVGEEMKTLLRSQGGAL